MNHFRETPIKTEALSITVLACCALLLGGCAWLPAAGPTASGVLDQARSGDTDRYLVVPADDAVLESLLRQPAPGFQSLFGTARPVCSGSGSSPFLCSVRPRSSSR